MKKQRSKLMARALAARAKSVRAAKVRRALRTLDAAATAAATGGRGPARARAWRADKVLEEGGFSPFIRGLVSEP